MMTSKVIQPALPLRFKKIWQALAWLLVFIVVWLSLTPHPPQPPSILGWDKAQHLLAYGGLMSWFGMSFPRHWCWPVFLIALGVALEFLQELGGSRTFDLYDMLANTLGVFFGLGLLQTPARQSLAYVDKQFAAGIDRAYLRKL
jgi:VanZ family protein